MKINNEKIVKRWNNVMCSIGCEHITINTDFSELESHKDYYTLDDGISLEWMINEAKYWLSCYYESGHARCDDRFGDRECYKIWLSETGKLKRLIAMMEKATGNTLIVEW